MWVILLYTYSIVLLRSADSLPLSSNSSEDRLLKFLFTGYNPDIRPVVNHKDVVNVRLEISLKQIIKVDFAHQILTAHIWIRLYWKNELLTWVPENFDGLKFINIEPAKVWIPDIILYNRATISIGDNKDLYRRIASKIILHHNGEMVWLSPVIVSTECKMNVQNFPFDNQQCLLEFGSWTHIGSQIDMNLHKPNINMDLYSKSDEWVLYNTKAHRKIMEYPCCPDDPWPTVIFTLFIKRRAMFYLGNLILPCGLITIVSLFSFILPPNSGERVSFVITILLALTVYMMIVTEEMPHSSDMPMASRFFLFLIVELSLSLVVTCFIIRLNNEESPLPKWLDITVNQWLAKIMCMKKRTPRDRNDNAEKKVETAKNEGYLQECDNDAITFKSINISNHSEHDNKTKANVAVNKELLINEQQQQPDRLEKLYTELKVLADRLREDSKKENFQKDWNFTTNVLDRFFLCTLTLTIFISLLLIFLSIPKDAVLV